ncbi:MAG TPA: hypothetical protein VF981_05805 [Gemmatimonadaceae bacterium]
MILSPGLRKLALTAHVTTSVGWIGAIAVFLGLASVGLASPDEVTVRAVYLAMEPAAGLVLMPLALSSLVTGLVLAWGTSWGLVRHYWVLFKLGINVFCVALLWMYMETFRVLARAAADRTIDLDAVRSASPVLHAVLALALLLVAMVLAVYKPKGTTPFGQGG